MQSTIKVRFAVFIGLIVIIMMFLISCGLPKHTAEVIFESKQCRQFTVPYEEEGYYKEKELIMNENCENTPYNFTTEYVWLDRRKDRIIMYYDVINLDNETLSFQAGTDLFYNTEKVASSELNTYHLIPGGRVKVWNVFFVTGLSYSGKPRIIVPQRDVCTESPEYREVIRHGIIRKNRTELICWRSEEELERLKRELFQTNNLDKVTLDTEAETVLS